MRNTLYTCFDQAQRLAYIIRPGNQEGGGLEPSHIVGIVRRILGDNRDICPSDSLAEEDFTYTFPHGSEG